MLAGVFGEPVSALVAGLVPSVPVSYPNLAAAGTTQSALAVMTQAARRNVEMFAGALNSICLGDNCGP
jgi:hypothetical protein